MSKPPKARTIASHRYVVVGGLRSKAAANSGARWWRKTRGFRARVLKVKGGWLVYVGGLRKSPWKRKRRR